MNGRRLSAGSRADDLQMELKMKAICDGRKTRQEVIHETVEQYRNVYMQTQQRLEVLKTVCDPCVVRFWLSADWSTDCAQVRLWGQRRGR